jgi:hypothetical protein
MFAIYVLFRIIFLSMVGIFKTLPAEGVETTQWNKTPRAQALYEWANRVTSRITRAAVT